ncbi:VWA domain-containing protein [Candidatus Woesearchaeota archaeon]|nr:VWA domain-containing protein [Candidatus Woesearchaeota archaeon]
MAVVFSNPLYLWFLLSVPLLIILHFISLKSLKRKALTFANFDAISRVTGQSLFTKNITLLSIRILILICIIFAISGTTLIYTGRSSDFDFILAIDSSSSMSATDFQPNRLEAAKESAVGFVDSLSSEAKIGLVTFSGTAFVESSLIEELGRIKSLVKNMQLRQVGGTNLGEAITTSVNLLLQSQKSKVIILLTDGRSNVGIPIQQAIDYANKNTVLVYTIGVATEEGGFIPELEGGDALLRLDEQSLSQIATSTGGKYFRAVDKESLTNAYQQISSSTIRRVSTDLSLFFMVIAFSLLFIEWLLSTTKFKILP